MRYQSDQKVDLTYTYIQVRKEIKFERENKYNIYISLYS